LVQDALSQRKVPSVLYTSASLFASREVVETQRVLAAIADPTHESQLMAALGTDLLGFTGSRIEAMVKEETEWQQVLGRFRDYLDLWLQRGFIQMFRWRAPIDQPSASLGSAPSRQCRESPGRLWPP
jgi:exodeoxyribonuclease V beta subunit